MEATLEGVRLKLDRAGDHLQHVVKIIADMTKVRCEMIPEEFGEGGEKKYGVLRVRLTPKPPASLSVVIGDFLFNVRSALDHLLWQLVFLNENKPSKSNMFPISSTPDIFSEEVKRGRVKGISTEAQKLLENLQPYHPGNEPLATLADLHNLDKHRTLNLLTAVAQHTHVDWSDTSGPIVSMMIGDEELRDGSIFGSLAMPFLSDAMRERFFAVSIQGHATSFIAFSDFAVDELEPYRVDTVLQGILAFARDKIVPVFAPFFRD
jgi:hypothetical protein